MFFKEDTLKSYLTLSKQIFLLEYIYIMIFVGYQYIFMNMTMNWKKWSLNRDLHYSSDIVMHMIVFIFFVDFCIIIFCKTGLISFLIEYLVCLDKSVSVLIKKIVTSLKSKYKYLCYKCIDYNILVISKKVKTYLIATYVKQN